MSDNNHKKKQLGVLPLSTPGITTPSPGILQKLLTFGRDPLSPQSAQQWPELQKAWSGRQIEMPAQAAKTTNISEMGPLNRWLRPDAYAATGPLGGIQLNRPLIEKEGQDINAVLAHELTHVGQGPLNWLKGNFGSQQLADKLETEARDKEATRKVRTTDIELRPDYFAKKRK